MVSSESAKIFGVRVKREKEDMQNKDEQNIGARKNKNFPYRFLIAPLVVLLFAIGWYRFSETYIQNANQQLVEHANLSVYVPLQQLSAYMTAVLDFTYLSVTLSLIFFSYYLAKFVRFRISQR